MTSNRRKFIWQGALGLSATAALPLFANARIKNTLAEHPSKLTILFQGDSITDMGRDKSKYYANEPAGMGDGYVFQIVSHLLGTNPGKSWYHYNRGISGNKVFELARRWDDDCLQLKPDVLSILIGVNDFWHTLNGYNATVQTYEDDFRKLLDETLVSLPNVRLIIGEPFAVKGGSAISQRWYPEFLKYQQAAARIAHDYKGRFVPYQQVFDEALQLAPVSYWCPDGVHPSIAGAFLMKEAWLKTFYSLF
ncbi:MAG: lysophospholipase [Cyclobacteriaceae bacterium]|nr:lysophospholipase [Cyclobacteriaceae bacterium]